MKQNKPLLLITVWTIVGVIYFPVFFAAWLLHIVARLILAISYLGLLNSQRAKDIFKSLFKFNPTI